MTKNCFMKNLWEKGTPYIQIVGWFPIFSGILTAVYMLCDFISTTQDAIAQVKKNQDTIVTIELWQAEKGREIDDMHEWLHFMRYKNDRQ